MPTYINDYVLSLLHNVLNFNELIILINYRIYCETENLKLLAVLKNAYLLCFRI